MGKSSGEQQEPTAGGPGYKVGNFNERRKAFIAERRKVAGISYKHANSEWMLSAERAELSGLASSSPETPSIHVIDWHLRCGTWG